MDEPNNQLGILTDLKQREGKTGSQYVTAWIKWLASDDVHLHQRNLADRQEAEQLANGKLVFFDTAIRQLPNGNRLYAINCRLAQSSHILDYLINIDAITCRKFNKRSASAVRGALLVELEKLAGDAKDPEVAARLAFVKSELLPQTPVLPVKPVESLHSVLLAEPVPSIPSANNPDEATFLRHVFTANSTEYASRLFSLLVEGVRAIADEDSFRQAMFLLEFNEQLIEGKIADLPNAFYLLATPTFRFQFWLRGLVPYCDTDVLLSEFASGDEAQKQHILERCKGEANTLLAAPAPPAMVPVLHTYFQSIKTALLEQLMVAQSSVRVAVAWFTQDELFTALCKKLRQGVAVELIINNDYINNRDSGLPFSKFINLGGKLYLSEYPAMMHHKFCLIDEAILFTGSYNWTYYADLHNEENVLCVQNSPEIAASFKDEFERLKQRIGSPVTSITPFSAEELGRFERIGFKEYLSKEIYSGVSYIREAQRTLPPQSRTSSSELAARLKRADDIDPGNEDVQQLLQEIKRAEEIENYAIKAQETDRQQTAGAASPPVSLPDPELEITSSAPVPQMPALKRDESPPAPVVVKANVPPTQHPTPKPAAAKVPTTNPAPAASHSSLAATSQYAPAASNRAVISTPGLEASKYVTPALSPPKPAIDITDSMSNTKLTSAHYDNLHVVLALDYSTSMNQKGYQLYSTGRVQMVIDMVFGIAKGLTSREEADVVLFEQQFIPLSGITELNYASYVHDVIMYPTRPMGGTNIDAPVRFIHSKYSTESIAKTGVFVILMTDGENSDKANDTKLREYFEDNQTTPIFWQFVGLGANHFELLKDVAKVTPNTEFFNINDVQNIDNNLLESLLQKFRGWYERTISVM